MQKVNAKKIAEVVGFNGNVADVDIEEVASAE